MELDIDARLLPAKMIGGEADCGDGIVKRHGISAAAGGNADETFQQIGNQPGIPAAGSADRQHIGGRGRDLAAGIEIDHAQRQAVGKHDRQRLGIGKGVEFGRCRVVTAGEPATHPGQVGNSGSKIGSRETQGGDIGERAERENALFALFFQPIAKCGKGIAFRQSRRIRQALADGRNAAIPEDRLRGFERAEHRHGAALMDWHGPAEACCGTGGVAADRLQRRIAEDQRDSVNGKACRLHHHDGGDIVEAHIGIDPHTHGQLNTFRAAAFSTGRSKASVSPMA
ncbi:Hypothetical protein AT6N2_L1915 [Agrobacterium tumefaciens]|nr:Hypothetical protein AT6N2_L1915 [Agrobacterium tumefaciens]